MKKTTVSVLFGLVLGVLFVSYGVGFLLFHKTKISDEEILIGRIGLVPFTSTEYAVNLKTGDEAIRVRSIFGESWFIDYKGECQCITKVHKIGNYAVSIIYDYNENIGKQVYFSTGRTVFRIVPYEQERHKFEEGLTIRNKLSEQYADILSL